MDEVKLGGYGVDTFTGFKGLVTGECKYLTGCTQFLIQPRKLDEKGNPAESKWLDSDRLAVMDAEEVEKGNPGGGPQDNPPPAK